MIDELFGTQGPPFDDEEDLTWPLDADSDDDGDKDAWCENLREERRLAR